MTLFVDTITVIRQRDPYRNAWIVLFLESNMSFIADGIGDKLRGNNTDAARIHIYTAPDTGRIGVRKLEAETRAYALGIRKALRHDMVYIERDFFTISLDELFLAGYERPEVGILELLAKQLRRVYIDPDTLKIVTSGGRTERDDAYDTLGMFVTLRERIMERYGTIGLPDVLTERQLLGHVFNVAQPTIDLSINRLVGDATLRQSRFSNNLGGAALA